MTRAMNYELWHNYSISMNIIVRFLSTLQVQILNNKYKTLRMLGHAGLIYMLLCTYSKFSELYEINNSCYLSV